jgi:hypothetical protein
VLGGSDPEAEAAILADVANVRRTGIAMLTGEHANRLYPDVATVASPIFKGPVTSSPPWSWPVLRASSDAVSRQYLSVRAGGMVGSAGHSRSGVAA